MNSFEIRGKVLSYGTSNYEDWIDVSTPNGSITCYLDKNIKVDESELEDAYAVVYGYLQPHADTDDVAVVATRLELK